MSWILITGILLLVVILAALVFEYSFLIPAPKGLPILMYHKISVTKKNGVTILNSMLEKQFVYLRNNGYQTYFFSEIISLMENQMPLPEKAVVLTFDDAYENFRGLGVPLLKKYGFKASVFVPVGQMGKADTWDKGRDVIMKPEMVRSVVGEDCVEIGIHSFLHNSYGEMSVEEMGKDIDNCYQVLESYNIPYVKVLAYPFGSFPKKDKDRNARMKALFHDKGLALALRIGNRINPWPLPDPYEVKRIDIKGNENFMTFKIKLKKGRKKLFS
jgi:peptidoglycan/xylan/chitin deacetylase (PgdA/CDA1 family)